MPTRLEISARETGAPSRIASSTVRSFRSFRSGGVARRGADDFVISSRTLTQATVNTRLLTGEKESF
jgi:hypothetical protein